MAISSRKRKVLDLTDEGSISEVIETVTDEVHHEREPNGNIRINAALPASMDEDGEERKVTEPPTKKRRINGNSTKTKKKKNLTIPTLKDIEKKLVTKRKKWMKLKNERKKEIEKLKQKYYSEKQKYDAKIQEAKQEVQSLVIKIQQQVERTYCTECLYEKTVADNTLARKRNQGMVCQGCTQSGLT